MNTPNPFQNEQPEQPKFRGLILAANIISFFLLFAVIITFFATVIRSKVHRRQNSFTDQFQSMIDSTRIADSVSTALAQTADSIMNMQATDNSAAEIQNALNEIEYQSIRPEVANDKNGQQILSFLDILKSESDRMAGTLEEQHSRFTTYLEGLPYDQRSNAAYDYFVTQGHASTLLQQLRMYRATVISGLQPIDVINPDELRKSLPLDDTQVSGYVTGWDESRLSGNEDVAASYLYELETTVRNFEGAVLNKIPRTVN